MSWQSTRGYYDLLNEAVAAARGGLHSAEILMRSVDFAGLEASMRRGEVRSESRDIYLHIMDDLASRGAEGIILGCTEIEMLVKPDHHRLPLYDTTKLHAMHAVEWALADS